MIRQRIRMAATFVVAGLLVVTVVLPARGGVPQAQEIRVSGRPEVFTVLQDAIDAAAAGDTLFVGPGRFDEGFSPREGWMSTLGYVDKRPLTIIGSGMDATILGPEEYAVELGGLSSRGLYLRRSLPGRFSVSDLTITGVRFGLSPDDSTSADRVRFENCGNSGVTFDFDARDVCIRDCQFRGRDPESITMRQGIVGFVGRAVRNTRVERCYFGYGIQIGLNLGIVDGLEIVDCEFGIGSWLLFDQLVNATLLRCKPAYELVAGGAFAVDAGNSLESAALTMVDCDMGDARGLATAQLTLGGLTFDARRCSFGGANARTIWTYNSNARVHSSFIRPSARSAVYTELEAADGRYLDFRHNYWWTTDSDSISAWIFDGEDERAWPDDPEHRVSIQFEPFLQTPVANEKESVGSLKARYRQEE